MAPTIEQAYQWCERLAQTHYENFPVASFFLPKKIRRPIAVIYAFARTADDIADEGNLSTKERHQQLDAYWEDLELTVQKNAPANNLIFVALQHVIHTHSLPNSLFFDLLRAFKQDIDKKIYNNFEELLLYCRYSANPVGRLLLHLNQQATSENCKHSDAICTALQLINFLQDISSDLTERNRCYLPQDEMEYLNIDIQHLLQKTNNDAVYQLVQAQLTRAAMLMREGSQLGKQLKGLFGLEIRFITQAGLHILKSLEKRSDPYARPTLKKWQIPLLLWKSLMTGI